MTDKAKKTPAPKKTEEPVSLDDFNKAVETLEALVKLVENQKAAYELISLANNGKETPESAASLQEATDYVKEHGILTPAIHASLVDASVAFNKIFKKVSTQAGLTKEQSKEVRDHRALITRANAAMRVSLTLFKKSLQKKKFALEIPEKAKNNSNGFATPQIISAPLVAWFKKIVVAYLSEKDVKAKLPLFLMGVTKKSIPSSIFWRSYRSNNGIKRKPESKNIAFEESVKTLLGGATKISFSAGGKKTVTFGVDESVLDLVKDFDPDDFHHITWSKIHTAATLTKMAKDQTGYDTVTVTVHGDTFSLKDSLDATEYKKEIGEFMKLLEDQVAPREAAQKASGAAKWTDVPAALRLRAYLEEEEMVIEGLPDGKTS